MTRNPYLIRYGASVHRFLATSDAQALRQAHELWRDGKWTDLSGFTLRRGDDAHGDGTLLPVRPAPVLDSEVTVDADQGGRPVLVLPDEVAAAMEFERATGWTEFPGIASGSSRRFGPGMWMCEATETLMRVFAASAPLPQEIESAAAGRPDEPWQDRKNAQNGWGFYGCIVGASGWDAELHGWVDYPGTRHLHVGGFPAREGAYWRYTG